MSTSDVRQGGGKPASGQSAAANWVMTLVINIVLPTATYFLLAGPAGMPEVPALLVSGLWPVLDIGYTIAKQRHVDEFGVFVLIGILIAVLTTVFSGSARGVFLKDSITTGSIGVVMLVTLLFGRPLTFYLGRRFATDGSKVQRDWWDGLWQYPNFRAVQRRLGAVWGGQPPRRGRGPRRAHLEAGHLGHGGGQQRGAERRDRGAGLLQHQYRPS